MLPTRNTINNRFCWILVVLLHTYLERKDIFMTPFEPPASMVLAGLLLLIPLAMLGGSALAASPAAKKTPSRAATDSVAAAATIAATANNAALTEESLKALEILVNQDQNLAPYLKQLSQSMPTNTRQAANPFAPLTPAPMVSNERANGTALPSFNQKQMQAGHLPALRMRGVVMGRNKTRMALLEVEGVGTFVVKEGDYIGLQQVNTDGTVLHIRRITALNVVVETAASEQAMVVQ